MNGKEDDLPEVRIVNVRRILFNIRTIFVITEIPQVFFKIGQAQKIAWFIQNYGYAILEGFQTLPYFQVSKVTCLHQLPRPEGLHGA